MKTIRNSGYKIKRFVARRRLIYYAGEIFSKKSRLGMVSGFTELPGFKFHAAGYKMNLSTMLKLPSAFLPLAMSAVAIVLVHLVTRFGCMSKRPQEL